MLRQRVFSIAAGYEDCNDAARLIDDPIRGEEAKSESLWCWAQPPPG